VGCRADALHRRLKARAALEGISLSACLVAEVRRAAERPSASELRQRLAGRSPVTPYSHDLLLPRIWELRHNVTACDAAYLVLAATLAAPLLTCDGRLKRVPRRKLSTAQHDGLRALDVRSLPEACRRR
jgi:predicted nucleic acid-binding protein